MRNCNSISPYTKWCNSLVVWHTLNLHESFLLIQHESSMSNKSRWTGILLEQERMTNIFVRVPLSCNPFLSLLVYSSRCFTCFCFCCFFYFFCCCCSWFFWFFSSLSSIIPSLFHFFLFCSCWCCLFCLLCCMHSTFF